VFQSGFAESSPGDVPAVESDTLRVEGWSDSDDDGDEDENAQSGLGEPGKYLTLYNLLQ
jgi:hypothetical protein